MKKVFIISLLAFVVLMGAGCQSARSPISTTTQVDLTGTDRLNDLGGLIDMNENGFYPSTGAKASKGKEVQFRNVGKTEVWPASDPHPTHTNYSAFDAKRGIKPGESYYIVFPEIKTYRFHDHLNPVHRGVIEVK